MEYDSLAPQKKPLSEGVGLKLVTYESKYALKTGGNKVVTGGKAAKGEHAVSPGRKYRGGMVVQ